MSEVTIDTAPLPGERQQPGAIARRSWESWKAGDVGVMPVVLGLFVIVAFFSLRRTRTS